MQNLLFRRLRIHGNERRYILHYVAKTLSVKPAPRFTERRLPFEPDIRLRIKVYIGRIKFENVVFALIFLVNLVEFPAESRIFEMLLFKTFYFFDVSRRKSAESRFKFIAF